MEWSVSQMITVKVTLWAIPVFFLFIFIEMIAVRYWHQRGKVNATDDSVSIMIGLFSVVTNGLSAFITLGVLFWVQQYQFFVLPLTIPVLLLCFVLDDFRYYVHHRIAHRCRWVWAMHVTHHSSQRISLAVALRQGWTKHFTGTMYLKVPLVLVGFDPLMVIFCGALNAVYQFFLHTETVEKLPRPFELILNTPSHHRVHHGKDARYLDANYAGTFIIWDRLFGTFVAEDPDDRPNYGLVKDIDTYNPLRIIFHEYIQVFKDIFIRGLTPKQRLGYLLAPPGWSHDGSRITTDELKAEYARAQAEH